MFYAHIICEGRGHRASNVDDLYQQHMIEPWNVPVQFSLLYSALSELATHNELWFMHTGAQVCKPVLYVIISTA